MGADMRARDYQIVAGTFDNHVDGFKAYAAALGLASEAGEVANEYERSLREGWVLNQEKVKTELGDVLWNVARLASLNSWSIEDLMAENIDKLTARYAKDGLVVK
jgi:NTP pyrophosphatase (non-canonical NTP hydrolase)